MREDGMLDESGKTRRFLGNLFADMAELIPYLEDKKVTDISITDSGEIILKKFGEGKVCTGEFLDDDTVRRIIYAAANLLGKKIDELGGIPTLEAVIPKYNARITGILPPWTMRSELTLRKPPEIIYTLEDYVKTGRLTKEQYMTVMTALQLRKNFLIGGSTGSGKSTFLNAILQKQQELTPEDTFYIVEDVPELQCQARLKTMICVLPHHAEEALKIALRWTPDRIIFGELRDGKVAKVLINSWNTGHTGGATTIHANNCLSMIERIEQLARNELTHEEIVEAINICVHLTAASVDEVYDISTNRSNLWSKKKAA
jgi:type IV secretion system protein VirB11